MLWNRIVTLLCGGALVIGRPMPAADLAPRVTLAELLSHDCARDVARAVDLGKQPGPVFNEGDLIFTSTLNASHRPVLMVDAGAGIFEIPLTHDGINRLRFELPGVGPGPARVYFMSYLHDSAFRSRYLEFAVNTPPDGHFELDYLLAEPRRAPNLLPHLEYAIMVTSTNVLRQVQAGRLGKADVRRVTAENCGHLARENPALARRLADNLGDVARLVAPPPARVTTASSARLPASLPN